MLRKSLFTLTAVASLITANHAAIADDHRALSPGKLIVNESTFPPGTVPLDPSKAWSEILSLPERYRIFIERGTVNIVDGYPNLPLEYTPQGSFYRGGNLIWNGQLNVSNPISVMDTISRKLSENR